MEPAKRRRWLILLGALCVTLLASFYRNEAGLFADVRELPAPGEDRRKAVLVPVKAPSAKLAIPERLEPRALEVEAEDAFGMKSWAPPPPPPPPPPKAVAVPKGPPPPPPKPTAPPLPFKYLGRIEENGVATLFLGAGDRTYVVRPGESLDGSYRLDSFQGNVLTFTYLPLNFQQALPVPQPN